MHVSKQVPGPCPAPGPAASPQALGCPAPLLLSPTPLLSENQERKKIMIPRKKKIIETYSWISFLDGIFMEKVPSGCYSAVTPWWWKLLRFLLCNHRHCLNFFKEHIHTILGLQWKQRNQTNKQTNPSANDSLFKKSFLTPHWTPLPCVFLMTLNNYGCNYCN